MKQTMSMLRRAASSLALIAMLCATLLLPMTGKAASPAAGKTIAPQVSVEVCQTSAKPKPTCKTFDMPQAIPGSEVVLELAYPDTTAAVGGFEFSLSSRLSVDEKAPGLGVMRYVTHYSEEGKDESAPRTSLSSSGKFELEAGSTETLKFPKVTVTVMRNQ